MLQVSPDRRPSATELVTVRLPPLMEQLIREEEEPEINIEDDKTEDTGSPQRTRCVVCVGRVPSADQMCCLCWEGPLSGPGVLFVLSEVVMLEPSEYWK